jgi:E3 ubiquitin-protein ligase SIAH1
VERSIQHCAVSVLLIHPHTPASVDDQRPCSKRATCELTYSHSRSSGCRLLYMNISTDFLRDKLVDQYLKSEILISYTDLSNGLPDPDERFQFLVPNTVLRYQEKTAINVGLKLCFLNLIRCARM